MRFSIPKTFTAYWLHDRIYGHDRLVITMLIARGLIKVIGHKPLIRSNGNVTDTIYEVTSEFMVSVSPYLSVYHKK